MIWNAIFSYDNSINASPISSAFDWYMGTVIK